MEEKEKHEIYCHLVNSGLAGALVFLGSFASGHVTWATLGIAFVAAMTVAVSQFKDYWERLQLPPKFQNKKAETKLFDFVV
jgi:hypothetical protein